MDAVKSFQSFLRKFIELSDDEFNNFLLPAINIKKLDRKQVLTKAGEVEDYLYFIVHGLIRKYYLKGKEEINTQISMEGHMIHSNESFHSRTPSEYYIETIEPGIVVSINYNDLETALSKTIRMERLGRKIITSFFVARDNWQMQMVKMTPRERFLHFVTRNPELMRRVPQKYLASYLNIKAETFSRFKHLLRNHSRNRVTPINK
jgi:CRP-like cAMP-binding protein